MNKEVLADIRRMVDGMPFGLLTISKHRSKVNVILYEKESTIAPKTNEIAFLDLQRLLNGLITASFSGKAQFELDYKNGTISLITIKNKEIKTYGSSLT